MTHKHLQKPSDLKGEAPKGALELLLSRLVEHFIAHNHAAKVVANGLRVIGVGFHPVIDHLGFWTHDVEHRAQEFLGHGYLFDSFVGRIETEHWWGKVFRRLNYPAIIISQPFEEHRGKGGALSRWVDTFSDKDPHHIAIRVEDIEKAVFFLEKQGVAFSGMIAGNKNSNLRQIFTVSEIKDGKSFSHLELVERQNGFSGFDAQQINAMIHSIKLPHGAAG